VAHIIPNDEEMLRNVAYLIYVSTVEPN